MCTNLEEMIDQTLSNNKFSFRILFIFSIISDKLASTCSMYYHRNDLHSQDSKIYIFKPNRLYIVGWTNFVNFKIQPHT